MKTANCTVVKRLWVAYARYDKVEVVVNDAGGWWYMMQVGDV